MAGAVLAGQGDESADDPLSGQPVLIDGAATPGPVPAAARGAGARVGAILRELGCGVGVIGALAAAWPPAAARTWPLTG